jgi:hypothetical protein
MKALLRPLFVGGLSIAIAGATLLGSSTVALALVKPVIQSLSIQTPVNEGDRPIVSLQFTDADVNDPHTVTISWGDGSATGGSVRRAGDGSFVVRGRHAYEKKGTRRVVVRVADGIGAGVDAKATSTAVVSP